VGKHGHETGESVGSLRKKKEILDILFHLIGKTHVGGWPGDVAKKAQFPTIEAHGRSRRFEFHEDLGTKGGIHFFENFTGGGPIEGAPGMDVEHGTLGKLTTEFLNPRQIVPV